MVLVRASSVAEAQRFLNGRPPARRLIVWKRYPNDAISGIYLKPDYRVPDWVIQYFEKRKAEASEGAVTP